MTKEATPTIVLADQLEKHYEARKKARVHALNAVSLDIKEGEFVAIGGPSGCGKSTLLLTLGGLLKPDDGSLTIANEKPYQYTYKERTKWRARSVGFVFQDFHLISYLDLRANVMTPSLATEIPNRKERAESLLEEFGLAERRKHRPSELSAGEQQRVALARALFARPKLLLADEPTGNLDQDNSTRVLRHLAEFAKSGAAVLLVTHDREAMMAADRQLTMNEGALEKAS